LSILAFLSTHPSNPDEQGNRAKPNRSEHHVISIAQGLSPLLTSSAYLAPRASSDEINDLFFGAVVSGI